MTAMPWLLFAPMRFRSAVAGPPMTLAAEPEVIWTPTLFGRGAAPLISSPMTLPMTRLAPAPPMITPVPVLPAITSPGPMVFCVASPVWVLPAMMLGAGAEPGQSLSCPGP